MMRNVKYNQDQNNTVRLVLRYRWPIVICISIIVLVVEYSEHENFGENLFSGGFIWETLMFGILMPVTVGLFLSLINDRSVINRILARMDRQRTLKNALISARDWDELLTIISQIPHAIFPTLYGDALYVYDSDLDEYIQVSYWMSIGSKFPDIFPSKRGLRESFYGDHIEFETIREAYSQCEVTTAVQKLVSYTFPIDHLNNRIATLQLLFLKEELPDDERLSLLTELLVDIALALQNYQYESDFSLQSDAARAERQRIARQLHDTLAQDLAFLRLKLEQLLHDERYSSMDDFGDELFRLFRTADHSYEQVRSSLRQIHEEAKLEFTTALLESANAIAESSNFQVELVQEGSPLELPLETQRKILYVMREVLRNIGKHAHANLTKINVRWESDCVQIDTIDNGVGFDVEMTLQEKQSYGLNVIEEVVSELRGQYDLQSTENDGTRFQFWFPISE